MSNDDVITRGAAERLPPMPRRRRWRTLLVSLLLVVAGAAIGAALTVLVIVRQVQHRVRHPEEFPPRAAARLQRYLELSDDQTRRVEAILGERQADLQEIRREVQPRVEAEIERIRREIEAVLDPRQAERWNTWLDQKRQTWLPPLPEPQTRPSPGGP